MSLCSGGRNSSSIWNVLFPNSSLQMSKKIYVAYGLQRHVRTFTFIFWSILVLRRSFSINTVPSSDHAAYKAEELRLGSLSLLCFQFQKEFETEPSPSGLPWATGFDLIKCQIMPNAPKCWIRNISSRTSKIINTHNMDTPDTGLSSCGDDATFMACISHHMVVDIIHIENYSKKRIFSSKKDLRNIQQIGLGTL